MAAVVTKETLTSIFISKRYSQRYCKRPSDNILVSGGSVAEWSACRTRNPAVPGSSPATAEFVLGRP